MKLRPYQELAIEDLYAWMEANDGNPLVVIPTGGGKSLILSKIIDDVLTHWPTERILVVTHVQELVEQNYLELMGLMPFAPAGIYAAGLRSRDKHSQILFCSIQSVYKKAFEIQRCNLIIVDEAHLIPQKDTGMYRKFIEDMRTINGPSMRVVGLTATPYRMDSGQLHTGDNALFDDIAHETSILDLVREGYLAPLISKATATRLDVSGVGTRGGEYIQSQLEAAVDKDDVTRAAVAEIVQYGADRQGWIIFGTGKSHCEHIRDTIRSHGISCEVIFGDTPKGERKAIIDAFKRKEIRALVSINVLTTGFNAKHVDLIAMMRPTKSPGLYVQIAGRGTRCLGANIEESIRNGKSSCLVLDFAGVVARFGPIDQIQVRDKVKGAGGDAVMKTCPQCEEKVHASVRSCPFCGFEFPPPEPKIESTASKAPIMSTEAVDPEWIEVQGVSYAKHEKPGRPPSLRVMYRCGLKQHSEWVSLELMGFPRQKATSWWLKRAGPGKVPATVDEALARVDELNVPVRIQVKPVGKYVEITNYEFPRALPFQQRNQGAAA